MKDVYLNYLFTKNILVSDKGENQFESLFTIANAYNIRVTKGRELASGSVCKFLDKQIPFEVPPSFYVNFPESVKSLSRDQLLFDQLYHYFQTYGSGNFEGDAAHSIFEETFEKTAFEESTTIVNFEIVTEAEAMNLLHGYADGLLASTRPLSISAYELICNLVNDGYKLKRVASLNTAAKLLVSTKNLMLADYIHLSDVIKVVEELLFASYPEMKLNKLNLKNKDRKFISAILDKMEVNEYQTALCFEKRAIWKGLLHHIHYQPKTEEMRNFVDNIRNNDKNISYMSLFEDKMKRGFIYEAAIDLCRSKGAGSVIRNLDYIVSRCKNDEEIHDVIQYGLVGNCNPLLLLQLVLDYNVRSDKKSNRKFVWTKNNKVNMHIETKDEFLRRKSFITKKTANVISDYLWEKIAKCYSNKLGKVYISEAMKNVAPPMQETASESGYGILPKGTRIHIPNGKIIRAFTYWEQVDDIDLSCIGVTTDGARVEFSWRTMHTCGYNGRGGAVTFSGDQTRGYNGGSEYFDINFDAVKQEYPKLKYIVFANNVFTSTPFSNCLCNAGYMIRDTKTSGDVWEPKTVKSSYRITGDTTQSYLFAIDIEDRDFVWLNMTKNTNQRIAGMDDVSFLAKYIYMTKIMSVYKLFTMLASDVVNDVKDADIVVTDENVELLEDQIQVKSTDSEILLALLNNDMSVLQKK